VGAEYVLRWLPRGTHDWAKFVRPDEVHRHVAPLGFGPVEIKGVSLNPLTFRWSVGDDTSVNYLQVLRRAA
jgi:2-polyprenyl-6-hydroxyphenyl methylase/3-demethylubiquinone-9 3-methyltransferase